MNAHAPIPVGHALRQVELRREKDPDFRKLTDDLIKRISPAAE